MLKQGRKKLGKFFLEPSENLHIGFLSGRQPEIKAEIPANSSSRSFIERIY